jgi:CRISPR-associated protein Csx1
MRLILQVLGRLDYQYVNFYVRDELIKDRFSSQALAKKFGDSKIIFLVPESLVTELANNKIEAKELLNNKDNLRNIILERLYNEVTVKDFEILIVQSIGMYKSQNKDFQINFLNDADNIILSLILDLLKRIEGYNEVILDISTGHNVYVTSLIDAARTLVVYFKLRNIMKEKNEMKVPVFKIAYSPPIIQSLDAFSSRYPIQLYDFDVKAFFEIPFKNSIRIIDLLKNGDIELKKEMNVTFKKANQELNNLITETKIAYHAIRYNVPLAYFDDLVRFSANEEEMLKKLRNISEYIIENKKEIHENNNEILIKRLSINRLSFANLILTIAFHNALRELKENLEKTPSIDIIKKTFDHLYKIIEFGLNARFLLRDLNEIEELSKYLGEGEEKSIKELQHYRSTKFQSIESRDIRKKGDIKRNFFAHSGFEETITLVKKISDKEAKKNEILLRYVPERKADIEKWLTNPED